MERVLTFSRRRKWIIMLVVSSLSCYGAYKVYHFPSVARKRKRMMKLIGAMVSVAELVLDSSETISLFSRDLKEFLQSDGDEIPNSLKQLSKIVRSKDFTESLARVSESLTVGIVRGCYSEAVSANNFGDEASNFSLADKITERIFSKAGTGFVSVVVGSFARNLVLGFCSTSRAVDDSGLNHLAYLSSSNETPRWVNILCDDRCKELLGDCLQKFVSTAVAVYLEKTMNVNTYDQIFAGLTNPNHRDQMRDILVSICSGALETLVQTSHKVFTAPASDPDHSIIKESSNMVDRKINYSKTTFLGDSRAGLRRDGWTRALSSTLAVPSNRKFVVDVTGRVTFETMKSVMEILLWKLMDGFRRSFHVVHGEVVDRGRKALEYLGTKSSVIVTVFLALYLHVLGSARVLVPVSVS